MSIEGPTPEFWVLVDEIEAGRLPDGAVAFVDDSFARVDSILETISSMRANGVDAPTTKQLQALANLRAAACRWLGRVPTEEECRDAMRRQLRPHQSFGVGGRPSRPKLHVKSKPPHQKRLPPKL